MAVNEERLRLFTTALRSGEFEQGVARLCTIGSDGELMFCCLGVATEVAIANGLELGYKNTDMARYYTWSDLGPPIRDEDGNEVLERAETAVLPKPVADWYGFSTTSPALYFTGELTEATELNDDKRLSFAVIADLFEETFLPLDEDAAE